MGKPLHVLMVEDSPDDAELLLRELRKGGYDPMYERVETASAMKVVLEKQEWDVVLADHALPFFSAIGALAQLQLSGLDIPFIIVSGTIGEDIAVASMKAGAHDYVMKNNLARLVPAIERGMKEVEERRSRRHAEEALRESEEKYRKLVENIPDIVWTADKEGNYIFISTNTEKICGYTPEEIYKAGNHFKSGRIHPGDLERVEGAYTSLFKLNKVFDVEYRVKRKDGKCIWIHDKATSTYKKDGVMYANGVFSDITERKQMEEEKEKLREQLYHAQRLDSVGKLAGGVAHDFNNILSAILGYSELLQMKIKGDDSSRLYIQKIIESAERATNLTQSLLMFSRKQVTDLKPVDLNKVVGKAEGLLSRLIHGDIKIEIALTDKQCVAMADYGQIEQVLMNLATNARDAMPNGGLITMSTDVVEMDGEFIKTHGYGEVGQYARISFSDTGIGMDWETKERVFEPFFTTKEPGKGTGLGLSIVYGIVKKHRGYINVFSEPGRGTTFEIYLPVVDSICEEKKSKDSEIPVGGTETILVAEDEVDVREITKTLFERHGYKVIDAMDGEDAVDKFMGNKERIHLLVLDVMMPKKNGKEVYDEIRKTKPDVKVLFMSGYSEDIIDKKLILEEKLHFIPKPVSSSEILRKVREVLDNK